MTLAPYYDHAGITIYHGDCLEILPQLDPVDAVVTDPPYGTGKYITDTAPDMSVIEAIGKIENRAIFGYPQTLIVWCLKLGLPVHWLVWWPSNGCCRAKYGRGVNRETEHIAIWGASGEVRQPGATKSLDPNRWSQLPDRKAPDVWRDAAPGLGFNSHHRLHPNQKPISLMTRLLELIGRDLILDPFMGSGTTLRAAKNLGRRAIGIEIVERYCEIAAKRLAQEVLPL